jgi:hypothetical protein
VRVFVRPVLALSLLIFSTLAIASCDKMPNASASAQIGESAPKKGERVIANLDVDFAATNALKGALISKFPAGSATEVVEEGLKSQSYDCGPDPTMQTERACIKTETKTDCVVMTIVRTMPYAPMGAQVIKACGISN